MRSVLRRALTVFCGGLAAVGCVTGLVAHAQVAPAATGPLGLSVFGGATGNFTGLNGGKNLSGTAGVDLELLPIWKLRPTAEGRITYPFHQGHIVGEKHAMGGLREPLPLPGFGKLHIQPFADVLFGWGRLAYPYGGFPSLDHTYTYFHTSSFTYGPGVGGTLRLSSRWLLQGDVQLDHFSTPVTPSGRIWSKPFTGAIVYRFDRYHDHAPWSSDGR